MANLFIAGVGSVELFKGAGTMTQFGRDIELLNNADSVYGFREGEEKITKIVSTETSASGMDDSIIFKTQLDGTTLLEIPINKTSITSGYTIDFVKRTTIPNNLVSSGFNWDSYDSIASQVDYVGVGGSFNLYLKEPNQLVDAKSVLVSKTLVDSSINLSVSLEDIRAGAGAKLYGKYAHTSGMTMKLTDAMFRMEFLAANIGSNLLEGGDAVKVIEKTIGANGALDISDINPQPIVANEKPCVWVSKKGYDEFSVYTFEDTTDPITTQFSQNDAVCVRYLENNEAGSCIKVSANFIPDTLTAILTAPLFAGDESNLESSTKVGTLTVIIPRFMLNGTADLSMTMTGASQTAIEGSALAVNDYDCENNDGYYAIINKVIANQTWYGGLERLVILSSAGDFLVEDQETILSVYGIYENGSRKLLGSDKYELECTSGTLIGNTFVMGLSNSTITATVEEEGFTLSQTKQLIYEA